MVHSLCEWFMQTYGDWNYQPRAFVMPISQQAKPADRAAEEETEIRLARQAETKAAQAESIPKDSRRQQVARAASQRQKTEAETRYIIDQQLRQVGWEVDTENLCFSNGTRPAKGRNIAIAEWPIDSTVGDMAVLTTLSLLGCNWLVLLSGNKLK